MNETIKNRSFPMDNDTDAIREITTAAFDALGLGFAAPIWKMFFPEGEPQFSPTQIDQMTAVFQSVLNQNDYENALSAFKANTIAVGTFVATGQGADLNTLYTDTNLNAQLILSNGFKCAHIYIAAASLNLSVLGLQYNANPSPAAQAALCDTALNILLNIYELQQQFYLDDPYNFIYMQDYMFHGTDPANAATGVYYFGLDIKDNVHGLVNVILATDDLKGNFDKIPTPEYILKFVDYNQDQMPILWSSTNNTQQPENGVSFFKCNLIPSEPEYYPVGDLCTANVWWNSEWVGNPPAEVLYFKMYDPAAGLNCGAANISLTQLYDDDGTNNPAPLVCMDIASGSNNGQNFQSIGNFVNNTWSTDDDPPRVELFANANLQTNILGLELWDNADSGAQQDCIVYAHPFFGPWGIFRMFRSHSRPNLDSVAILNPASVTGFKLGYEP